MKKILTTTTIIAAIALTGCGETDTTNQADNTEQAQATAADVQDKLNVFFDDCEWEKQSEDTTPVLYSCENNELFMATGKGAEVKVTTESVAKDVSHPVYATMTDTFSVYSTDKGTVNKAWDALGADADAKPTQVGK